MKKAASPSPVAAWFRRSRASLLVLALAALLFAAFRLSLREPSAQQALSGDYVEYASATTPSSMRT